MQLGIVRGGREAGSQPGQSALAPTGPRYRLVGREAELSRLLALLDDAAAAQPGVALVSGDAGVGKTRLVNELVVRARERGFTVLRGQCAELGDSVPYLPLADALREAYGAGSGPAPARAPGGRGAPGDGPARGGAAAPSALAAAVAARPVLGQLLPDRDAAHHPEGDSAAIAQQQLFGAVLGLLAELAEQQPVVLILEDLHWADRSTRDLVTFLSRVLRQERAAIIGTYRTDDLHRRHPLRPVIAELLRLPTVTAVELGPLGRSDLADHLSELAGREVDVKTLDGIVDRAEGNAFYAEELLTSPQDGDALPAGLADLLLSRVERLSHAAQQVLRAAAVAGRRADDELVREAARTYGPDGTGFDEAVREAVAAQVLVPDGANGYAFRHALLREAIYNDLLPGERTRLHATLAGVLAAQQRSGRPGVAAELAHHSLASHDIAGAFAASVRAAQEAQQVAAPAEAHRHFDRALSLWDRVDGAERLAGTGHARLALLSASAAASSGKFRRAAQQLRRLRDALAAVQPSQPELVSEVNEELARYLLELGEFKAATAAAHEAVDVLPEEAATAIRARALATHARTLKASDDATAWSAAERALHVARVAGAASVEADALVTLATIGERDGRHDEAIELFRKAHRQAIGARVLSVELRAQSQLVRALYDERGDLPAAAQAAHDGVHRTEETGLSRAPFGFDLHYLHFLIHYTAGNWDHAQDLADGFPVKVGTIPEAELSAMALFIDVGRGNDKTIRDRLAWLERTWAHDMFAEHLARGLLAEHALWHGDTQRALREVERSLDVQVARSRRGPEAIRVATTGLSAWADRAAHARATGDRAAEDAAAAAASVLIEAAREGAANPRHPGFVMGMEGRAWLARAEAEWRRVQGDNDPAMWREVAAAFGYGFEYEVARCRWRLAEALAEAGQREQAQREWRAAAGTADRLGAAPLASALAELARRARLNPAPASPAPGLASAVAGAVGSLTEREREVLSLLARGRSNREIAAELFISVKTASVHVSHILTKLGAASRTEAAAVAYEEGLAGTGAG